MLFQVSDPWIYEFGANQGICWFVCPLSQKRDHDSDFAMQYLSLVMIRQTFFGSYKANYSRVINPGFGGVELLVLFALPSMVLYKVVTMKVNYKGVIFNTFL